MRVLVTGCAGFIGMHCAKRLLERGGHIQRVGPELARYRDLDAGLSADRGIANPRLGRVHNARHVPHYATAIDGQDCW